MKVKSVLFSEMRNKLGNQIVGTGWKGRMVFRAYKVPANPKTCSQLANRDHTDKVLKLYQTNVGGSEIKKAKWDVDALPRAISGYNLFMMLGRSSRIDCDLTRSGAGAINGHYTVKKDISTAGLYVYDPNEPGYVEVVAIGDMEAGDDVAFEYTCSGIGIHLFYIVDGRSKTIPPVAEDLSALVNNWSLDESEECAVVPALCSVT